MKKGNKKKSVSPGMLVWHEQITLLSIYGIKCPHVCNRFSTSGKLRLKSHQIRLKLKSTTFDYDCKWIERTHIRDWIVFSILLLSELIYTRLASGIFMEKLLYGLILKHMITA